MNTFVAASLRDVSGHLRDFFVAERTASTAGYLQRLDARAKLLGVSTFVAAALVTRSPVALGVLAAVAVSLAFVSSIPLRRLLARSSIVPLASAVVVAPQIVLMEGEPIAAAFGLAATRAGIEYVVLFVLRVWVTVAFLSLLVLTTRFSSILAALRRFGVPDTIVWVVALAYRYLFLFFSELQRMLLAYSSRSIGGGGGRSMRDAWTDTGRLAGTFLLRTIERSERVHRGMRARGGRRPPSPYERTADPTAADYLFVGAAAACLLAAGVIRWVG